MIRWRIGSRFGRCPRVELRGISKHFGAGPTRVDALTDIDLVVRAGETVGLRGPSGSGKSTLLNVIGCVIEPSCGWMRLDGEPVYDGRWLRGDLRRLRLTKIGFIFQTHNLLPFLNATENVAEAMELAGVRPRAARARAEALLDYLGVGHRGALFRASFPAAWRSASRSRARSPTARASSSPTSRPRRSIRSAPAG